MGPKLLPQPLPEPPYNQSSDLTRREATHAPAVVIYEAVKKEGMAVVLLLRYSPPPPPVVLLPGGGPPSPEGYSPRPGSRGFNSGL